MPPCLLGLSSRDAVELNRIINPFPATGNADTVSFYDAFLPDFLSAGCLFAVAG
jgi:hypothetical protein